MRIAVMMRSADETGGIGVYARNIIDELLKIDTENEYVLFYKSNKHLGSYTRFSNCREVLLRGGNKAIWDQILIPRAVRKAQADLVFNPKFTVPLCTSCKTVMVVHGADWFVPPYNEVYTAIDNLYIKWVMPLYFRKADFISSVSNYSTEGFVNAFPWCKDKIKTIYFGPNKIFKPVIDKEHLNLLRNRYNLPESFILTVIRYDHGGKNTRKNFKGMAEAYSLYKKKGGQEKFVVVGRNCHLYAEEHDLQALGIQDDVLFPGFVPQEDLPAFYSLAKLYLYTTIIEAFPIPTTEAMACGCPIVTSKGTGLEELTHDVALAVDPHDYHAIAEAMEKVLTNEQLQREMREKGFQRSTIFSWEKCALETLKIFKSLVAEK